MSKLSARIDRLEQVIPELPDQESQLLGAVLRELSEDALIWLVIAQEEIGERDDPPATEAEIERLMGPYAEEWESILRRLDSEQAANES